MSNEDCMGTTTVSLGPSPRGPHVERRALTPSSALTSTAPPMTLLRKLRLPDMGRESFAALFLSAVEMPRPSSSALRRTVVVLLVQRVRGSDKGMKWDGDIHHVHLDQTGILKSPVNSHLPKAILVLEHRE